MPNLPFLTCTHIPKGMCCECAEDLLDERDRYLEALKNIVKHMEATAPQLFPQSTVYRISAAALMR